MQAGTQKEQIVEAWHFLPSDRRLCWGTKELVEAGKSYVQAWPYQELDKPTLCEAGMHASRKPLNALSYAAGSVVCRVLICGRICEDDDKLVGDERRVLWMADAEQTLREFSRWCARSVLHLWYAPEIVRQYLETGDENIRTEAWDAALHEARTAAFDSARDEARIAAWAAAWEAACAAAWDEARATAWAAARTAAWAAARAAAWDAARTATWGATRDEAWDAALDEARTAANIELERLLLTMEPVT